MGHPEDRPFLAMRKALPYTSVAVILALLYVAYVFYSRHAEQKNAEEQQVQKQQEDARKVNEAYGGDSLKILSFTAEAAVVHRGEPNQLCYSVANAQKVTIEPDVHDVPPSYSNCVKVTMTKDTDYTLTVTNAKGKSDQATLKLRVD
jgi:hypothetical protein